MNQNPGVSIVICCHNSAGRLKPTLEHLKRQVVPPGLAWEVLVIDNASTDDTARVAPGLWNDDKAAPLRVVAEPKMGLSNARARGFAEARFDLVSFVDDDNWVAPDWVAKVFEIMASHPEVGACGGIIDPVFESRPPTWFEKYKAWFAVGEQGEATGDITATRGFLWGAGVSVRNSAWKNLILSGFSFSLTDRIGKQLSTGGDMELVYGLVRSGWRLWFDQDLKLKHFMPENRLHWHYLRRVVRGLGAAKPILQSYRFYYQQDLSPLKGKNGKIWTWKLRGEIHELMKLRKKWLLSYFCDLEGDDEVLAVERLIGIIGEMIRIKDGYDEQIRKVVQAKWNSIKAN